jgi:hypothetical protein
VVWHEQENGVVRAAAGAPRRGVARLRGVAAGVHAADDRAMRAGAMRALRSAQRWLVRQSKRQRERMGAHT